LIEKNGDASEALRELNRRGLDTEVVLDDLFLFCGGTAEEIRAQLEKDKRFRDELIDVANQLERLAGRVERIAPKLEEHFPIKIYVHRKANLSPRLRSEAHFPIKIYVPRKANLSLRLRSEAHFYRGLVDAFYGPYLKNVKFGGRGAHPANITSGRDQHLLHLICE
jgi:hypothetical protein